jgi:hypothetical protein
VVIDVHRFINVDNPLVAVKTVVKELHQEFGSGVQVTSLEVMYHDEDGILRSLHPDALSRQRLARGSVEPISLSLPGASANCGVYPVIGGGWSVLWLGKVLSTGFETEAKATRHIHMLCDQEGGHTWIPDPKSDLLDLCARCGAGRA